MAAAWVEVLPWVRVASRSSGRARRIVGAVVTGRTVATRRRRPHALNDRVYQAYTHTVTMTTIKLDSTLRDRLNTEARRRGQTAGTFVEDLFAIWLREQRFAEIRRTMAGASDADIESYRVETAALDALAGEGLDDGPAGR